MDTSKIIKGVVNSGRYTVTAPIIKEDYGLYLKIEGLELPSTYEVDFSNSEHNGTSVTMIGNSDGVLIPSQFISSGKDVFAFLYHVGEDFGRTVYKFRIPNKVRPDRTDETPTPEEQSVIDQAISALNTAVAQTAQDVIDADASAQSASQSAENAHDSAVDAQNYAESAQTSANNASASASQASTSATASAQSASDAETARQATTSLVAEAQRYANASEQSATASANSAEQAESAKGVAQSYAQDAQTSATYASLSESTASTKASEASGYASTASQKATEASQSASQALTYKNDAESAKTASQTAQGKAEDAQTAAETAQGKAEDAQEAAESAAASVSASAAQIAENTADIADLQTDVAQNEADVLKAFPTDTASGAIASFSDGADNIPLKSLVVDINPVQDLSNGDPSPENICPISGWTGCNIQRDGTNLWGGNISEHPSGKRVSGYGATGGYPRLNKIINPNTYTLSVICNLPSGETQADWTKSYNIRTWFKSAVDGEWYEFPEGNYSELRSSTGVGSKLFGWTQSADISATPTKFVSHPFELNIPVSWIVLGFYKFGNYLEYTSIQLEVEDASSDIETYNGTTLPISWQTEAGTVYGGRLDVLTGILTVYPEYDSYNGEPLTGRWISDRDVYAVGTTPTIGAQVVNIGAEGMEYQLEPHEIASLLGQNNIFADTGDSAVEYRADTRLYIEKLTQPEEDDMIADSNIVSGQYFMVGNSLFKATANIASGSAVIVGTNATRKSLSEALNEINA